MEVHVSLVGRQALAAEIYQQLRASILDGRMRPGDALPPSRELARHLSVSRTTVVVAYDRLSGEGFVTSRVGAGTFVSSQVPKAARRSPRPSDVLQPRAIWAEIPTSSVLEQPAEFDFRTGLPDAQLFPFQAWRRLMTRELSATAVGRGMPGDPAGDPGLRQAIARHLGISRAVNAEPEAVTVTNGTQQALDLVARVLLAPGDRVAVEDPGYSPPALLFKSLGLQVTGVPVDGEGLMVDSIPRNTKLVYVTPSHQYPLGTAMSLPRRIALLAWADRHNAAIVEDDYDSEFRFGERPIEPVQTLDTTGRVIYVGSFSKTMLPILRMGFVITPPSLWDAVHSAKFMTDWHTSLPMQRALATFIDQGSFARHVRKMRTVYRGRHERILHFLSKNLSPHFSVIPSAAGLHISAFARTFSVAQIEELVQRVAGDGVAVQPLSMFRVSDRAMSGLVLGYGAIPASQVDAGLRILLRHTVSIAGAHRLTR